MRLVPSIFSVVCFHGEKKGQFCARFLFPGFVLSATPSYTLLIEKCIPFTWYISSNLKFTPLILQLPLESSLLSEKFSLTTSCFTLVKLNTFCHINKQRMSLSSAIVATIDSELVSPEGMQEVKNTCHLAGTRLKPLLMISHEETQDVKKTDWK